MICKKKNGEQCSPLQNLLKKLVWLKLTSLIDCALIKQKKQYPQQGGYLVVGIACVSVFNILILKKGDRY